MRRFINRLLCLLLCVCLIIPLASERFYAVDETDSNLVYINDFSTQSGCEIELPVYIENNTGLSGFWLIFDYDTSVMTPVSVEKGEIISSYDSAVFENSIGGTISDRLIVMWANGENVDENGELLKIKFYIKPSAHGAFPIRISYNQRNTYDENFADVTMNCQDGTVSVDNQQYLESTRIFVENANGTNGTTVIVPVKIANNSSLNQTNMSLQYNSSAMSLVGITDEIANVTVKNNDNGFVELLIENIDNVENGILFDLEFLIAESAGGLYTIQINCSDDLITENGTIEIDNSLFDAATTIYAESIIINPSETEITIPVKIRYNHGIMGYKMSFHYDSTILSVKKVTCSSDFSQGFFDYNADAYNGTIYTIWTGNSAVNTDGDLLYITFELQSKRPASTALTIDYSQNDTFDNNYNNVELMLEDIDLYFIPDNLVTAKENANTVVSSDFIFGIEPGTKSLSDYLIIKDGYSAEYSSENVVTGQTLGIYYNDLLIKKYTVILFGDVNGDGWYDGQDSFIVNCIANGLLSREQIGEAKWMAADCNHDGEINSSDVLLLEQAGLLLSNVDQTASKSELIQSDSYIEYLNLIDQNPNDGEITEIPVEEPAKPESKMQSVLNKIIAFIKMIIDFIRSLAVKQPL